MRDFKDKVAVIIGISNDLGKALVLRCIDEDMKVVIADSDSEALSTLMELFRSQKGRIMSVVTNISDVKSIEQLTQRTLDEFGRVNLLFYNATIGFNKPVMESSFEEWQEVIDNNIWGMVHSNRLFIRIMLNQGDVCHVVNIGSLACVIEGLPGHACYSMTYQFMLSFAESAAHELKKLGSKVNISVACPTFKDLNLVELAKAIEDHVDVEAFLEAFYEEVSPQSTVTQIFRGIRKKKLYIFPDATDNYILARELVVKRLNKMIHTINKNKRKRGKVL